MYRHDVELPNIWSAPCGREGGRKRRREEPRSKGEGRGCECEEQNARGCNVCLQTLTEAFPLRSEFRCVRAGKPPVESLLVCLLGPNCQSKPLFTIYLQHCNSPTHPLPFPLFFYLSHLFPPPVLRWARDFRQTRLCWMTVTWRLVSTDGTSGWVRGRRPELRRRSRRHLWLTTSAARWDLNHRIATSGGNATSLPAVTGPARSGHRSLFIGWRRWDAEVWKVAFLGCARRFLSLPKCRRARIW